ncbi:heavy-metal-associated domain-containing protein [Actinotalea sp. M2MS4P-6]|uniref:heavy-metal-associated domain-containing protein n=1 Tax=Actinotalea sp. M2MS4P-6 TaxID=2983762 RepID=UPI0021E39C88|nr:heavy-metal-associated domain-containing protein [Actinotalea sp. M2MS4P-6]MCV2392891.1 heavy-metal-associated domain-containing protein [Actinotalea sp. M2MS4P-6]
MSTQTVGVAGMTCHHCVMSVTEEISEIPGVTDVAVELVAGGTSQVTVTADQVVEDAAIAAAVAEAGYAVVPKNSLL